MPTATEPDGLAAGYVDMANDVPFPSPFRIRPGDSGSIREVVFLSDAREILIDWPHARRGPFYQSARELVEAALDGNGKAALAHEAFLALCDHAGVLVR